MPKRILYRRLDDRGDPLRGLTLEEATRRALNAVRNGVALGADWAQRCRQDPFDEQERLFINHHRDRDNYVFSNLVSFTEGRTQAMLEQIGNIPEIPIETFAAPDGRQFMNGMLFWMITGNHAFLIQDPRVRAQDVESYLHWLIGEQSGVLTEPFDIALIDEFDSAAIGDFEDIKQVIIGGTVMQAEVAAPPRPRDMVDERDVTDVHRLGEVEREDWKREVLAKVLGGEEAVERMLERLPPDANLKVEVQLGITTKRRGISRDALRDVQRAARNLPESDLKVKAGQGTLSGDKVRLAYPVNVLANDDLLDRDDVLRAMIEAYRSFVMNGKIEASAMPAR
jgi:hypothetical protein